MRRAPIFVWTLKEKRYLASQSSYVILERDSETIFIQIFVIFLILLQ